MPKIRFPLMKWPGSDDLTILLDGEPIGKVTQIGKGLFGTSHIDQRVVGLSGLTGPSQAAVELQVQSEVTSGRVTISIQATDSNGPTGAQAL